MTFPAHIKIENGIDNIQSVKDHLLKTAEYASCCLEPVGLGKVGYLAGLVHDMGKYSVASKLYQEKVSHGIPAQRGSVIHTFQGCRFLLEKHSGDDNEFTYEDLTSECLAYAVAAHHGLFDCYGEDRKSGFYHREKGGDAETYYEEVKNNFLTDMQGTCDLDELMIEANAELSEAVDRIANMINDDGLDDEDNNDDRFYFGLLTRTVLSALIEGDRRDTAEFLNGSVFPEFMADMRPIWQKVLNHIEMKLDEMPQETEIQNARRYFSDTCRDSLACESGIGTMNLPTGGGKTLSALRAAVAAAAKWNKRRIIFTAPLLTIIEQNADVIKSFVGDESIVLEHHSDVLKDKKEEIGDYDELRMKELLVQNWQSPIIITTMVQLLNTMFDGRTTSIRRFWALCDSVIVIDEVQSVPSNMISLFNLTINYLTSVCHCIVILSSATQPCFEKVAHPMLGIQKSMAPYNPELWRVFDRTEIRIAEDRILEEIPDFLIEQMETVNSLLVVCNKKSQVEYLYEHMKTQKYACFHLSASMCKQHRENTMNQMKTALKNSKQDGGKKVICVSSQVIEAGVDISVERVVRFAAGLDNVIQAAGRCNRNGEQKGLAPVFVVNCKDENLQMLPDIQRAKTAFQEVANIYREHAELIDFSLSSEKAVNLYYRRLYSNYGKGHLDFTIKSLNTSLYSLLSSNNKFATGDSEKYGDYYMVQAFKLAGNSFSVFDAGTQTVVVPYGKGKKLIAELSEQKNPSAVYLKKWIDDARPYTISIYSSQKHFLENGGIVSLFGILVLNDSQYDEEVGMKISASGNSFEAV